MGIDRKYTDTDISLLGVGLTEEDIFEAMKAIPGYIDITLGDFKELYCIAYRRSMERFARSMKARDIMKEQVVHVLPETPLMEAAQILGDNGVSGAPVIDEGRKVVGVVSEKDILSQLGFKERVNFMLIVTRCLQEGGNLALPARSLSVKEIMSSPAVTVSADTPLLEITGLLTERKINRLPVTDSDGRLLGILARNDIVNATLRSGTCSWNTSEK